MRDFEEPGNVLSPETETKAARSFERPPDVVWLPILVGHGEVG